MSIEEVVDLILGALTPPLVEFITVAFAKDAALQEALSAGLNAAIDAVRARKNLGELLNPGTVLKAIGSALEHPKVSGILAERFTQKAGRLPLGHCRSGLEEAVANGIRSIAGFLKRDDLLTSAQSQDELMKLLEGGGLGLLRGLFREVKPVLVCMLTKDLPEDLKGSFGKSLEAALALIEEPEEIGRVLAGGVPAVVGRVIELTHEPLTALIMRQFPEGPLTSAVRAALLDLGREASSLEFLRKIAASGVWGIAGEAIRRAADPLAVLLTSGFDDAQLRAGAKSEIERLAGEVQRGALAEKLKKRGLVGLVADFAAPIRKRVGEALASVTGPLAVAVRAAVDDVTDQLAVRGSVDEVNALLREGGRMYLARLRAYLLALLARGDKLAALAEKPALALGAASMSPKELAEAAAALRAAAEQAAALKLSVPAMKEVLR
jgi:hypothetical protein